MRVLIATPAYGGMIHSGYVTSLVETFAGMTAEGIRFSLLTLSNESLISRARNKCASIAIEKGFDQMIFVDSDISWRWTDMKRLIQSDKKVVGGTYPMKTLPIALNFNPLDEHFHLFGSRKSPEDLAKLRAYADPKTSEIEVRHVPTGFLKIDVSVFSELKVNTESYSSFDVGGNSVQMWDFFPVKVRDGILNSEDWSFCNACRDIGIPIYMNTDIVLTHAGTYEFSA